MIWRGALALLSGGALAVLFLYSPGFPDPDMIRWGLFVPFVSLDEALCESCSIIEGDCRSEGRYVYCYDENGKPIWAVKGPPLEDR
jgi:hypothetical protein